ncbi:MAG: LysM peptidoglycan-binding domain-containing protein, partial [Algoriphagus sp.]|nr:LysM peptidoglycan-binding domain-containing protein [Algoriphagus sp.]
VLGTIASKYSVSVSQVKKWNNLNSNLIRVGQTLYIYSEKAQNPTSNGNLAENNSGSPKTYTVRPGDSLWIISQKHSLSVEQIKRLNNLNSNSIKPGQRLIIG